MPEPSGADTPRAVVVGAGAWGTAFGQVLVDAGTPTTVLARRRDVVDDIVERHRNARYLPGVELTAGLTATADPDVLQGARLVVLAVPSTSLRATLTDLRPSLGPDVVLLSLVKGVEAGTDKRMSEVMREVTGVGEHQVAVLTGPNLAGEIATRQPAAGVVACTDLGVAAEVQQMCHGPYFRPYVNHDVVGCELGGAVKNVIAIAVGIAVGLGFGDNARASVITRGIAETARIGEAMGADPMTFAGLAGVGDLVATCSSPLSRNRTFGERVGRGTPVAEVLAEGATVEGARSCRSILDLADSHDVRAPIVEHVVQVVHHGMTVQELLSSMLAREPRHERDANV